MESFTKGPWAVQINSAGCIEVSLKNNSYCWSEDSENYLCIGISSGAKKHPGPCNNKESLANATLIAAAPEMYEMIQKVVDTQAKYYGDGMGLHLAMINLAREAESLLIKARGEV